MTQKLSGDAIVAVDQTIPLEWKNYFISCTLKYNSKFYFIVIKNIYEQAKLSYTVKCRFSRGTSQRR